MSEAVSALAGATYEGYCNVTEAGRIGMVTLRGDLSDAGFAKALRGVTGLDLPGQGAITGPGPAPSDRLAWMSPDELLLFCDASSAPARAADLAKALAGQHALVADVTDARAVFRLEGEAAREVMSKLTPADVSPAAFGPGRMRRTRLAQVPAAFHMPDETSFEIVTFRSVARYAFDLLSNAARRGSEVGLFTRMG